jgi:lactate dehydrogenase-like 2-hydroxyacid dehydrogenase
MSKSRKDVDEMIDKKTKKYKKHKENTDRDLTVQSTILKFIDALDEARMKSKNCLDFTCEIDKAAVLLEARMKSVDTGANIKLVWNDNAGLDSVDWKALRMNGVEVTWSPEYLKLNPDKDEYTYIDVGNILLGLF